METPARKSGALSARLGSAPAGGPADGGAEAKAQARAAAARPGDAGRAWRRGARACMAGYGWLWSRVWQLRVWLDQLFSSGRIITTKAPDRAKGGTKGCLDADVAPAAVTRPATQAADGGEGLKGVNQEWKSQFTARASPGQGAVAICE